MSPADLVFVDTNVLLYSFDSAEPAKQSAAAEWLNSLWALGTARLSWQVIHEFNVNATRKIGLPTRIARRATRTYTQLNPTGMNFPLLQRAWHWMDSAGVSYWDALILASAEGSGCRWLLSEDFRSGRQYGPVRVIDPFTTAPAEFFAR